MRNVKIQVLMNAEEVKILDQIAESRGLSRSALLRQLLLAEQKKEGVEGRVLRPRPKEINNQ